MIAFACWATCGANAIPITIANHSFEDVIVPDGYYTVNTVAGWVGEGSWYHVANPTDAQFTGTTDGSAGVNPIDGRNVAAINNYGHLIYQPLTATVLANTTYTLRVLFGHRNGVPEDSSVNLLAGNRFLARGFADTLEGTFTELTVVFNSGSSGGLIGQQITVELRSAGVISQGWFDNVRLDATPSLPGIVPTLDTAYVPIPMTGFNTSPQFGFSAFSDNGPLSPGGGRPVPEGGSSLTWLAVFAFSTACLFAFNRHRFLSTE
jgi:hypothetical protein